MGNKNLELFVMHNKQFLYSLTIPVSLLSLSCTNNVVDNNPNIILIMSDDQGWGDLSVNGNLNLQTPNIDFLAEKGAKFNSFYVCPVSSPTRAELLTGRYHDRMGVSGVSEGNERMNPDETTVAEIFKKAGYKTAIFGKWHNGTQYPYHPNARGFDEFYGFCSGHWGEYFNARLLEHNGELVQGEGYIIDDFTEKAISYIESNKSEPFFIYIPYNSPHSPMQVPDKWWNKFKDKELLMFADDRTKEDINFTRAALAMCENIDWNVGRIISKIQELDLEKETIIVYLSDNGPNGWRWNNSMKGRKGSTDEGGIRSPLIISWPGKIKEGLKVEGISAAIDLLPTLCDLAGIKYNTKKPLDGISLKPLLFEKEVEWSDRMIFSSWNGNISVRNSTYRLDNQGKLFNLTNDPSQLNDISKQESQIAKNLKESIEEWKKDVLQSSGSISRKFTVGHPDADFTFLPARDASYKGNVKKSNKSPNSSFLTNWISEEDEITWDIEVFKEGNYEIELYYTCPKEEIGSLVSLKFGREELIFNVDKPNDPPLEGMENDRILRTQSYVKDFKPLKIGTIHLKKGSELLTLRAKNISKTQVMDLRLLSLKRE